MKADFSLHYPCALYLLYAIPNILDIKRKHSPSLNEQARNTPHEINKRQPLEAQA
ncbi:hypothetical protein [Methyloglobulus sp.]|uniref:hypothetical protein n=1 Tax=Methyloglobulus sp. TaxID=2518622 RepID=UPI0039894D40